MTECAHTGHMLSLMYLCIGLVTCVESISFIFTLIPSKCNIRSICLDCFSRREWKGPGLESQVFCAAITPTPSLDLQLPVFPLTAGRYLSNGFPSVSADIVLPLFAILIYQLSFIRPPPAIILSPHTALTPWSQN